MTRANAMTLIKNSVADNSPGARVQVTERTRGRLHVRIDCPGDEGGASRSVNWRKAKGRYWRQFDSWVVRSC